MTSPGRGAHKVECERVSAAEQPCGRRAPHARGRRPAVVARRRRLLRRLEAGLG